MQLHQTRQQRDREQGNGYETVKVTVSVCDTVQMKKAQHININEEHDNNK